MFCGCCNTIIDDDSCFCKKCGTVISTNIETECELFHNEAKTNVETRSVVQSSYQNKDEEQLKEQVSELFFMILCFPFLYGILTKQLCFILISLVYCNNALFLPDDNIVTKSIIKTVYKFFKYAAALVVIITLYYLWLKIIG